MRTPLLVTGLAAAWAALVLLPQSAPARQASSHQRTEVAGWPGHCVRWRPACVAQWGWGSWHYRRCMVRHGCRSKAAMPET